MEINLKDKTPNIRYLNDIKAVLFDQEWAKTAPNHELYYMYRGLQEKGNLVYDITVIPSRMLGEEFVKTKGHYHIEGHGELYMVLEGEAFFLMQKEENGKILDVYCVNGKKGDFISVPSLYGHITINNSSQELKMANWVSKDCKPDYSKIEQKRGACYYYIKTGWVKNENYEEVPELRFEEPEKIMPDLNFLSLK